MDEYDEAASGLDLDALQAQINMAMAETEELVSSWVQPSKNLSQRPKRSIEEVEKELKEYLRRPPRLGVGAPIPEPVGPSAQEEAKLKNKLVGNEKKRRRDDDTATNNPGDGIDEEEEETRKGESSTKIARTDPFSLQKKKKAKHKALDNGIQVQTNGMVSSHPAANAVLTATPREFPEATAQGKAKRKHESLSPPSTADVPPSPIPVTSSVRCPNPFTFLDGSDRKEHNISVPSGISPLHTSVSTLNGAATSASSSAPNLGGSTQQQLPTPAPSQDTQSATTSAKKKKKKKKRKAGEDHVNGVVNSVAKSEVSQSGKPNDAKAGLFAMTITTGGTTDKEPNGTDDVEDVDNDEYDDANLERAEKDQSTASKNNVNGIAPSPKSRNNDDSDTVFSRSEPPHPRPRPPTSLSGLSIDRLLNLTSPPESVADTDDEDNNKDETPSVQSPSSPSKKDKKKKKRRHKKKKKKHNLTGSTTNA